MTVYTLIDQAIDACEAAGLEPRRQYGGLGETTYWLYFNHSCHGYFSDSQFLGWCNECLNGKWNLTEDDEEYADDNETAYLIPVA